MSRVFFTRELEGVANFWRVYRCDGVTLGFTSHDRDLDFGGIRHRAAPGMLPSAIRRTADLAADSAEIEGALSHDTIAADDLASGRYDGARIEVGAVDWETHEHAILYSGALGRVQQGARGFAADLVSAKSDLDVDLVPRTSPTCRARFCGPGCGLSPARFTSIAEIAWVDADANAVGFPGIETADYLDGEVRLLEGQQAGLRFGVVRHVSGGLVLDRPLDAGIVAGMSAEIRQGCDHTVGTCGTRFANAQNFRGEPFLPGNDLLARYPVAR